MVNSIEDLKSELKSKSIKVQWRVRCHIGPDWIGGGREVCFYLDNQPLEESEFHNMLIKILINKLNIPSSTENHVINGDGEVTIINSDLVVRYSMESYIPYDWGAQRDKGEIALISEI